MERRCAWKLGDCETYPGPGPRIDQLHPSIDIVSVPGG